MEASINKGMHVWFSLQPEDARKSSGKGQYARGVVVTAPYDDTNGNSVIDIAECEDNGMPSQQIHKAVDASSVVPANPVMLEKVEDLTELTFLNEPSILHVLKQRYDDSMLYTHAGPVLVAVNPFKKVDLYSKEHVDRYVSRPAMGQGAHGKEYTPHIFLTADKAFKEMKLSGTSQSILITGESGAGKTETTKFVMKYVAGLAGGSGMEHRVLETNPILEAFGNAKTLHNNNSSRFGKLIDIHFDESFKICGASIETYLLEKSRVVHQLPGERNYHIFYQLIRGGPEEIKAACMLPDKDADSKFVYLNSSGCSTIDNVDDAQNFRVVCEAMTDIGIDEKAQLGIWKTLSCILWLGNVEFDKITDDSVSVRDGKALEIAAALMGVSKANLEAAITTRKMFVGGDVITKELNLESAQDVRDALVKFLYEAQFRDLIHKVNSALEDSHSSKCATSAKLSLLDIYGFECFKENSFEQLCINYANERLQQQFAAHLFKLEQSMYEEEGVDWKYVEFEDNQACVDLIESKPPSGLGVLTLLDEECLFPKGTDSSFSEKVCKTHAGNSKFTFNANKPGEAFTISHYAGPVTYSSQHFLDKNRDTLNPDLMNLVQSSDSSFVASLSSHMGLGNQRSRNASVGSRFRDQLKVLLERLDQSQLHFVRCIKPNALQKPMSYDNDLVLHQLKCCGILEVARIARAGYPTRYSHTEFAERYRNYLPLCNSEKAKLTALETSKALLNHFRIDESVYQVGKTKLFFRAGVLGHLEDHVLRTTEACLTIQSVFRMHVHRKPFIKARQSSIIIQSSWRAYQAKIAFLELKERYEAACKVQAWYRAHRAREEFLATVSATISLQRWWRQVYLRSKIAETLAAFEEKERAKAQEPPCMQEQDSVSASTREIMNLEEEFNMDRDQIRNILQQYVAGKLILADGPADPDLALQELQRINVELQKEIDDLRDENALLVDQQAKHLSAKKQPKVVAITADASDVDAGSPRSADSVSIMSYSDNGTESAPYLASARREMSFGRAGPQGAVAALSAEMSKKGHIFTDDAAFIREVHEGVSMAPNMDPDFEIKRLVVRYKTWNRDFKARLKATQHSLRKSTISSSPAPSYLNSSAKPIGDPVAVASKPKKSDGISNRLKSLTRVARVVNK